MTCSAVHVDDIGTTIILVIYDEGVIVNISTSLALSMVIKKPDGSKITRNANLYTDGIDGKMYYAAVSGDFSLPGTYYVQGIATLTQGIFHTDIESFKVEKNL